MIQNNDTISPKTSRIETIAYWITTILTIGGALVGGTFQLLRVEHETQIILQLDYPLYIMTIIGVSHILAAIALIIPRFPLLKIWAYAGLFFVTTGAVVSHALHGDVVNVIPPLIVDGIIVTSYLLSLRRYGIATR